MARYRHGVYVPPVAPSLRLEQAPGKRYLQRTTGQPFQVRGDSLWCLCQSTQEEREELIANVAGKGFNAIVMMSAVSPTGRQQYGPPQADGLAPFTGSKLVPNDAYWTNVVKHSLSTMRSHGIVMWLSYLFFGHGGANDGFRDRVSGCSESECEDFGRWLGQTFREDENLIWVAGGDNLSLWDSKWQAMVDGLLTEDDTHLIAGHPARNQRGSGFGSWITLETSYPPASDIVAQTLDAYGDDASARAVAMYEGQYEGDGSKVGNPNLSAQQAYVQSWQALLSNAACANFGTHAKWTNGYICNWPSETTPYLEWPNWKTTQGYESDGSKAMAHTHAFFDLVDWPSLVGAADATSQYITGSRGSGANYVAAAATPDLFAAILPAGGTVPLNMSKYSGPMRARFYDPTNGEQIVIDGSDVTPLANSGSRNFTAPTNNAGGTAMALWLEAA